MYEPPSTVLSLSAVHARVEPGRRAAAGLRGGERRAGWWLGAAPVALSWACASGPRCGARVDPRFAGGLRGRLLIAVLIYSRAAAARLERYSWWLRGLTRGASPRSPSGRSRRGRGRWRERAFRLAFWNETRAEKETDPARADGRPRGAQVLRRGRPGLERVGPRGARAASGRAARIKVCAENHGGERRVLRVKCAIRTSRLARGMLARRR